MWIVFLIIPAILLGFMLALVAYYWREFSETGEEFSRKWLWRWSRRGLATPLIVWVLLNAGSMPFMPPLTRSIGSLRAAGNSGQALLAQTSTAALVIVSCWAAMTFGWFMVNLMRRAKNGEDLILAAVFWSPVMLPVLWALVAIFGWSAVGFAGLLWIWPLAQYALNQADVRPPAPSYSSAIGKMKFGKYAEAEKAIIGQLESCETDFEGWMMLAELYANQFHDLAEAEKTILDLCAEPATTLPQVSIALHRLADWQLHLRGDPAAARRALEEICARMPGTHLALMARHRLNQLPDTRAQFEQQQKSRTFHLPAFNENLDTQANDSAAPVDPQAAMTQVNALVENLNRDPNDAASREKLARVFAEQLGQLDLALEQLELLAAMPQQPPEKMAELLGLMAAWLIKYRGEGEAAGEVLLRLVHEYPQSPQAFAAQKKLTMMKASARVRRAGEPRKIGDD